MMEISSVLRKNKKILWSKFSLVDIITKYVTPHLYNLEKDDIDPTDSGRAVEKIAYGLLCFTRCSSCENNQ